jgi:predicted metal-dependent hydrolase
MNNLKVGDETIPYEVKESADASLARIDIDPLGVKVVVPRDSDIDPGEFIEERREWVLENYLEMQEILKELPERSFEEGEKFPYQGKDQEIRYSDVSEPEVKNGELHLPREDDGDSPDEVLEDWLREEAREKIKRVIEEYSDRVEGSYNKIYIRNQKTKWGSCSGKNNLSFNFRLIMAPPEVLEYVVVHELVHLEKPEHSKAFWRKLSDLLPDYQESKEWLKENKMKLVLRKEDVF